MAAWLFPGQSAKKSKGARNKAAKKRKATVKTAVAAARYYDDNSPQLIIEGLGSAQPEINQNDNDDEDEGEDDDDDGGVPVPVSFSSLAYRPAYREEVRFIATISTNDPQAQLLLRPRSNPLI